MIDKGIIENRINRIIIRKGYILVEFNKINLNTPELFFYVYYKKPEYLNLSPVVITQ